MLKWTGILALTFVIFAAPLKAEQLMVVSPQARLNKASQDSGQSSQNVSISAVKISNLPKYIQDRVNAMVYACTADAKQLSNINAYAWSSDRHASRALPPNYIIDLSAVKAADNAQACGQGPVCNDEGCLVLGYTAMDASSWKKDFEIRSTDLSFLQINGNDQNKTFEIQTVSNNENCTDVGGIKTNKGCVRRFIWRDYGLKSVPPP